MLTLGLQASWGRNPHMFFLVAFLCVMQWPAGMEQVLQNCTVCCKIKLTRRSRPWVVFFWGGVSSGPVYTELSVLLEDGESDFSQPH